MTERMMVIAPNELMGGSFVHPQMISDLFGVASIENTSIKELSRALEAERELLTEEKLSTIVSRFVHDERQASCAAGAIMNLSVHFVQQAIDMIDGWRKNSKENAAKFPEDSFVSLKEKLPLLVRDYPAVLKMRKAEQLINATGNECKGVQFICDARPVFDNERRRIEGVLSLTTMKIVYERQNDTTEETEIRLTSEQIDDLIKKATQAKEKLKLIDESIALLISKTTA